MKLKKLTDTAFFFGSDGPDEEVLAKCHDVLGIMVRHVYILAR